MQAQYMVALCDILGFSSLIKRNSLEIVVNREFGWFRRALFHSVNKNEFPFEIPKKSDFQGHEHVGVAWFSDTILLYTLKDNDEAVRQLLMTVGWLIFETILGGSTRIRGGVSYGEAFIDKENSIFLGMPIVEAYRLEQRQQWAGAALTDAACERIPEYVRSGNYADWWVIPYDVPLKENRTYNTLAINWTWGIHQPERILQWSEFSNFPSDNDWKERPDICEKFINTKEFHDTFCRCRH